MLRAGVHEKGPFPNPGWASVGRRRIRWLRASASMSGIVNLVIPFLSRSTLLWALIPAENVAQVSYACQSFYQRFRE